LNGGAIAISSVTAWEIALLAARGRIVLSTDVLGWLSIVEEIDAVKFIPLSNEIAVRSTQLGEEFPRDPADRFIVATALTVGVPLVTADDKIRRYPYVKTIW
jgi:PIN domain nuclease of toxin-antitoxin system